MSWSFLTQLLDEISNHSTMVGKIWFILLIVFRIVLTAVGGESVYNDEQDKFVCNTLQPGCENVCYDKFAPLSHMRFWIFQVIMTTTPTIMYLGFAMHKIARMEDNDYRPQKRKQMPIVRQGADQYNTEDDPMTPDEIRPDKGRDTVDRPSKKHDGRSRIKRDGLMKVYVFQLLSRAIIEVSFLFGQYVLYGLKVEVLYKCTHSPCPHTVNCYISRPTEKTIFLLIMYSVSALCLLFTVLEILHLGYSGIRDCFCAPRPSPPTRHPAEAGQESSICCRPSAPPTTYKTALKKVPPGKMGFGVNLEHSGPKSFGDKAPLQELERLHGHLKRVQQYLDMAYQNEEDKMSCSSRPQSNGTTVEQSRQEFGKRRSTFVNGTWMTGDQRETICRLKEGAGYFIEISLLSVCCVRRQSKPKRSSRSSSRKKPDRLAELTEQMEHLSLCKEDLKHQLEEKEAEREEVKRVYRLVQPSNKDAGTKRAATAVSVLRWHYGYIYVLDLNCSLNLHRYLNLTCSHHQ
ncbi:hypothetical protein PAMA_022013 [Pampus argenteus]